MTWWQKASQTISCLVYFTIQVEQQLQQRGGAQAEHLPVATVGRQLQDPVAAARQGEPGDASTAWRRDPELPRSAPRRLDSAADIIEVTTCDTFK